MPFLSRIRINPLRAESRKLLASPRAMHAAVQGGIPGLPAEERTLWRLDADNPHRPQLFVLTTDKPDWTHLVEQAGWPAADGEHYAVRDYTPLLQQLATGRSFAFRLTANPVQNTNRPDKPTPRQQERIEAGDRRSFRLGHRTAAAQLSWFLTRTARWGFDVPTAPHLGETHDTDGEPPRDVRITTRQRRTFSKGTLTAKEAQVVMNAVTFEGHLRITDPALLTERLLAGIGPAKAYGCGLLTLAPLPERA
ncbi:MULTISPECIES: type I-E CRISPR-associated protein Cas6/Cse3/CasE [unclassified Streptomyces]|uniref:type I-E CRISPR-associated protein Cas6/Cse3/CasE n=1 Tax=unclassified Streptomyces TaxID=2593676 RepID=UPI0005A6C61E|nr:MULTISPECIES: type I-E CRISPR-associated protein Cas6/Cse3/CasE [unclassified Streptomyces]ODA75151.1 CRISPR-associated endoribonuclease Cse3 [Streptomyces sp. AVP053U2]